MPSKNKKRLVILLFITILAFTIRIYHINSVPPSLFSDEVDAGYQAFIFNQFKTDYFGNKYPSLFHSFADYRTPALIYSIALSQKIFGLNDFSIRFPSILFGSLTVFAIYFLSLEISKNKATALFTSFLLAINPWHIHYSRTAFEVSGMLLFYIIGLIYSFKFIQKTKPIYALIACLSMLVTMYFYATAKLFILLTLLVFLTFYHRQLLSIKLKTILPTILISLLFLLPILKDIQNGHASYRLSYNNVWSDPFISDQIKRDRHYYSLVKNGVQLDLVPDLGNKLSNNKFTIIAQKITKNYLHSFSTQFLFLSGDGNLRQGFKNHGYFYLIDFFLIAYGLTKIKRKKHHFLLALLLLSPLPFVITNDSTTAHATRLFFMIPLLLLIINLVFIHLNKWLKLGLVPLYLASFFLFFNFYLFHYPSFSAREWHYNIKQTIANLPQDDSKIIFSNQSESFLPFFLYYAQYRPTNGNLDNNLQKSDLNFVDGQSLDNHYYFGQINWHDIPTNNTLYVINQEELKNIPSSVNFDTLYQSPPSPYQEKINYSIISVRP